MKRLLIATALICSTAPSAHGAVCKDVEFMGTTMRECVTR